MLRPESGGAIYPGHCEAMPQNPVFTSSVRRRNSLVGEFHASYIEHLPIPYASDTTTIDHILLAEQHFCPTSSMTTVSLSQPEIVAELLEIQAERRRLEGRETELLTLLQEQNESIKNPVPLIFGKNVITWEGGALSIRGNGYLFLKVLYEADGMQLTEDAICGMVWRQDKDPEHHTFKESVRWLTEKLEKARFPYQLLPVMSEGGTIPIGEKFRNGKQKLKHVRPEIIGVKLNARKKSANLSINL